MTEKKICVCCFNAGGEPDIYFCKIRGVEAFFEQGEHYTVAEEIALEEGYERPMVSFDEDDSLFYNMNCDQKFVWDSAYTYDYE